MSEINYKNFTSLALNACGLYSKINEGEFTEALGLKLERQLGPAMAI